VADLDLVIFWIGVVWLSYTYALYPLILALLAWRKRVDAAVRDGYQPSVSVLICARNEEKDIGWKIDQTLNWDYPAADFEVLVASDASEDRTDEIVRGIQDPRLTLIRMETRGGKGRALNQLVQRARGDVLFFTDANAHIGPECLRRMIRHLGDPRVGCVTGGTGSTQRSDDNAIGGGASVYLGYESLITRLEDRLGSVLACDGAIFCIKRSLFHPVLPDLANDLELPLRIRHAGYWTKYEPRAQVLERDTESPRQEFARRRRIAGQGALTLWKMWRTLSVQTGWQLFSHKILRYLTPVPLFLVLASTVGLASNPAFGVLLGLQMSFYLLALLGFASSLRQGSASRLVSIPFYIVFGSLGAFAGVLDACRGRRFAVWEIATLSRGVARNVKN
jgi:cellulose synthase/poly-beta-1,6-N-acetylglucosamine synthase-like glycosyltransferase